jgi:MSHA biogenesis protein MshJ
VKEQWIKLSGRIDAMSLRERVAVFAAAVALVIYLLYVLAMEPMFARNQLLLGQIRQQNSQIVAVNGEIAARMAAFEANPDLEAQRQLAELTRQTAELTGSLRTMQRGLVAPEKMPALLQQLLRTQGKLTMVSLRTLPVSGLGGAAAGAAPAATGTAPAAPAAPAVPAAPKPRELLYRHGVEVTVQGSYFAMLDYLEALEGLPSQLFWGKAELDASGYPQSRLTLTLYTLSLGDEWMTL